LPVYSKFEVAAERVTELTVAPGEPSHVPADVTTGMTTVNGQRVSLRIDANTCKKIVATVPRH
jgi:hypothetical protein